MKKQEIIDKLRIDEHYYGEFGQQYLSNSNIKTLLKNPLDLHKPTKSNPLLDKLLAQPRIEIRNSRLVVTGRVRSLRAVRRA